MRCLLNRITAAVLVCILAVPPAHPLSARSELLKWLLNSTRYDSNLPPNFDDDEPVKVAVEIFVSSFDSINEITMDYTMSIFLRRQWTDHRLKFNGRLYNTSSVTIDPRKAMETVWIPDVFFSNEKTAKYHDVTQPNHLLRIDENGTVFFSSRVTLTLDCPMYLRKFPLDSQNCSLILESFAYTKDRIQFDWAASQIDKDEELKLPQFFLLDTNFDTCTKTYKAGIFSCLRVDFSLKRDINFYIIQTYLPSVLIVTLSWVSFWISYESVPARISLGLLTVLTLTTQTYSIRATLPRVSYVKSIDVWMAVCLVFVFLALLEFAIVNINTRRQHRYTIRRQSPTNKEKETHNNGTMSEDGVEPKLILKLKAAKIDRISRILFPVGFVVFNIIYWMVYILIDD
ncbi:glycine receptor subunit alpha-2 isoform X2 [Lingula anatina]|uniref:Gamma-aminobutyric acid receptor subunit beta n=1 Tax=Lingula anatina TaxID=7574 RepID=A0A1S3HZP3_LINAN|nr:glycine receptor subunit alpha-2 isoform X2 [Lingula anatina]XP_013390564.1 glycine receptor subunit alpha-2 isoform X2 [Lingula anatina]|eukprot:XP_013390563.1 glycine receptor subunit alpha-2 isoform X2 [Lingula anatina]